MCTAPAHVRFTHDRESGFPQTVMSALPPKADMCGATRDVCFGPEADIGKRRPLRTRPSYSLRNFAWTVYYVGRDSLTSKCKPCLGHFEQFFALVRRC